METFWRSLVLTAALLAGGQVPPKADCPTILKRLVSGPRFSPQEDRIRAFYEPTGYDLAWVRDGRPTRQAEALIQALRGAAAKGLNPEDYRASGWAARLEQLRTQPS